MDYELPVNEHLSVGPTPDIHGHGPVTTIGAHIYVCLDCGYTTHDERMLHEADCERGENGINSTWRERLEADGLVALDERSGNIE